MDYGLAKGLAEKMLLSDFSNVEVIASDGVFVQINNGKKVVGGADIPQILRAFSLLKLNSNKSDFTVSQYPKFKKLGIMLDMSRGGVMRVEAVKEYINRLAMFGANELFLYTEDIYTLEDYPHFGYLRGAYTDGELREIDDYAYSLDIEIIPCIQTLGHMEQYLSWKKETADITDTADVLMCDSEATYNFIEAEIAKMRKVFRSRQIHIGMDEASGVGLGKYLKKNGFTDRYELLKRHLSRVIEICSKYGFSPMMWSDMFFRLGSSADDYYNYNMSFHFPESVTKDVPDATMVYWDYYNKEEKWYKNMIRLHRELGRPIVFAGGNWVWSGFLPDYAQTIRTMLPALKTCREEQIDNVFATMWGDDGCETDYFRGIYTLAYFSEYCYSDEIPTQEQIDSMGQLISGVTSEYIAEISKFHLLSKAKALIWEDIFYNSIGVDFSDTEHFEVYSKTAEASAIKNDEFAILLFKTAAIKAEVYANLQKDYKGGKDLAVYRDKILPELVKNYERLYELHSENWYKINKPFGFEDIEARYAAMIFRIKAAIRILDSYCNGNIPVIEELEYKPVYGEDRGYYYTKFKFPKV